MKIKKARFVHFLFFISLAVFSPNIMSGDLASCAEPLILRDGVENPFNCNDSPTFDATPAELRSALGEQKPIEFCIPESGEPAANICSTGSCGGGTGCLATYTTQEIALSATNEKICGHYVFHAAEIDVHYSVIDCEVSFDASADVVMTVDSTYTGPLTWEISGGSVEISGFDSKVGDGCGLLGDLIDAVIPIIEGSLISQIEGSLSDGLSGLSGVGICPVDSLHEDLILP